MANAWAAANSTDRKVVDIFDNMGNLLKTVIERPLDVYHILRKTGRMITVKSFNEHQIGFVVYEDYGDDVWAKDGTEVYASMNFRRGGMPDA